MAGSIGLCRTCGARSEAVGTQHPAAALLAAAKLKDSQASRGRLPVCLCTCGPCVCLSCVGVRRGSLPGGVQHAVNRALLRVHDRERRRDGRVLRLWTACLPRVAVLFSSAISADSDCPVGGNVILHCHREYEVPGARGYENRVRRKSQLKWPGSSCVVGAGLCMCAYVGAGDWIVDKTREKRLARSEETVRCSGLWCRDECQRSLDRNPRLERRCDGGSSVESKREIGKCSWPTFPW